MPARTRRSVGHLVMSTPSNTTRPPRAGIRPITVLSSVVLPTPLRPMRHTTLFAGTVRSTDQSTCDSPYAASRLSTVSMGLLALAEVDLEDARLRRGPHRLQRVLDAVALGARVAIEERREDALAGAAERELDVVAHREVDEHRRRLELAPDAERRDLVLGHLDGEM